MKKIIIKIWATLAIMCFALPFVKAQTVTLFESNFNELVPPLLADGTTQGNASTSISLTDATLIINQMGFGFWDGTQTLNSPPQAPANSTYPYFFRFTAAYTAGTSTKNYIDITPTKPFYNGGRITVMLSGTSGSTNDAGSFTVVDKNNDAIVLGTTNGSALKTAISECTIDLPVDYSGTKTIRLYRSGSSIYLHYIKIETYDSGGPTLSDDATLTSINVRGVVIPVTSDGPITVDMPYNATAAPSIEATTHVSSAHVTNIANAGGLAGSTTITVTAENGTTKDYTVYFNVLPPPTGDVSVWNFSDFDTNDGITSITTIKCLTILPATSGTNPVAIDGNPKSIDGFTGSAAFSQRLKLAGTGSTTARCVSFDVTGNAIITVYGMAPSPISPPNPPRTLNINAGSSTIGTLSDATGSAILGGVFKYTGGSATTIYMFSPDGGFNIYYIRVEGELGNCSDDATLATLKVGSTTVPLVTGQTDYTVNLPVETETVPTVTTATPNEAHATVDVTNATAFTGTTLIDVTAQDGTKLQYKVSFNIEPAIAKFVAAGVEATIDNTAGTIKAELSVGESLNSVTPAVTMNAVGDHYTPTGAQDFSSPPVTYTVYNAAGTKSKDYMVTLTVAVGLSDNATLSDIKFKGATIAGFAAGTNSYNIELPYGSDVPVADDVTATVTHLASIGTIAASDTKFPVDITIPVTAQDGSTTASYVLHFTMKDPSKDVTLSTLTVSGTDVLEAGKTDYVVELPFGAVAIPPVTATATDANATVLITPTAVLPGTTTVDVTAEDGVTKQQYKVTFNPLSPLTWNFSETSLFGTAPASGQIDITAGVFNCLTIKGVASGTAVGIDGNGKSIDGYSFTQRLKLAGTGNPATEKPNLPTVRYLSFPVAGNAKITIYGMSSNSSSATLEVTDGVNIIGAFTDPSAASNNTIKKGVINYTGPATTIYLYSLSGGFNIYGILVDGALGDCTVPTLSGDVTLKSLAVNGTAVTLVAGQTAYTVDLPIGTETLPTVTAAATNSYATVKITDAANLTGTTTIDVTAEDGTKLQYKVSFNVLLPDPLITAFKAAGVTATIDDAAGTIKAELPKGTALTAITPEVTMNAGGDHYAPAGAKDFTSPVTYTVYNAAGTKSKAYTVTLTVAVSLSNDASLSDIQFKSATIDGFAAATTSYNIVLPFGSAVPAAADVTAAKTHPNAIVGTITASDTKFPVDITIPVTAEDGTTKANYVLHFTMKAGGTDASLKTLTVSGNTVLLEAGKTAYTVDLPEGTTAVPVVAATANDSKATVKVTDAANLTGQTTIDVTAEDGVTKQQYTVSFNVLSLPSEPLDLTWNFSKFTAGDIAGGMFDCLTVKGVDTGTAVSIEANNKSIDGYSFTQRLKLGGGGNPAAETPNLPTQRYLSFPVAGNAIITIYGMSSSTTNNPRTLEITNGTTEINTFVDPDGSAILKKTISYTGPATTIYLYAAANGFNIYAILVQGTLGDCTPIALSNDATLKSLTVNGTAVTLSAGKTAYTVDLPVGTTAVPVVAATANDSKATVKITDAANLTGTTTIDVTAEDGTKLQYKVSFNVLLPDPLITAFKAAGVTAAIDDAAGTIKAELPMGTALTAITPEVTMNAGGDHYAPAGAKDFTSPVTYTVYNTAETKSKAYTVTLTVALTLSTDATLKTLTVNGTDVLEAAKTAYTVNLPYGTTEVPVIAATANNERATVQVTDAADLTEQTIIDVTAEDGVTKLQYTVSFNVLSQYTDQTTIWNFSDSPFEIGDIEGVVNGLTIKGATSGAVVMIDNDNESIDDYVFTQRLELGGSGNPAIETPNLPTERYLSFDLTGDATITIYGLSDNDTEGTLVVTDGKSVIGTFTNDGISIDKAIFNYTGSATTLYIYSLSGGFNIYAILVDGDVMLSLQNVTSGKEIKFVSYYDLLGRPVPASTTGLIIVKTTYKDGSSTNIKVYRQRKYVR